MILFKFIINIYFLYQLVIKNTDEEVLPENYPRPINGQSGCPHSHNTIEVQLFAKFPYLKLGPMIQEIQVSAEFHFLLQDPVISIDGGN